jgi:hypothetical protein
MSDMNQEDHTSDDDGNPKFGRLLAVLVGAVLVVVAVTFASEAYFS